MPMGIVYDKHLQRLIYLGYWRTKQWKYLVILVERKSTKLKKVWEQFKNPKIENEVLG